VSLDVPKYIDGQPNPAYRPPAEVLARDRKVAEIIGPKLTPAVVAHPISMQGLRGALGDVEGERFVRALRALKTASQTDAVPEWLTTVLTSIGRPADTHALTLGTIGAAVDMLGTDKGIDVGDPTTRGLIDLLAAGQAVGGPVTAAACTTIKALAHRPRVVTAADVSVALRGPWGD
jgi:hypothetical protein